MKNKLIGTISVDVDTFEDIFKSSFTVIEKNYHCDEFTEGLNNLNIFLKRYQIKATLFCVGQDLRWPANQKIVKNLYRSGYEIASHTMHHAQGLRLLTTKQKIDEIAQFEKTYRSIFKCTPVGFRSPGWNIDDSVISILVKRGYKYDSSLFPTSLTPLMKLLHFNAMKHRSFPDRTTLGSMKYIIYPTKPFRTSKDKLSPGKNGLIEFPVSVTPIWRFPIFATGLFKFGVDNFSRQIKSYSQAGYPLQFMLHLFDFVDFKSQKYKPFIHSIQGEYTAQSTQMSLTQKLMILKNAFDIMTREYIFKPYRDRL